MSRRSSSRVRERSMPSRDGRQNINENMDSEQNQQEVSDNEPHEEESDCYEYPDQEPRYDPKELRDAVRVLSPFVRLIGDIYNPYARIVAREVCKTFYRLFHPNVHPVDAIKDIDWKSKGQKTDQLWSEFWLYVPGANVKEWVPLSSNLDENDVAEVNDCECCLNQPQVSANCGPNDHQQRPKNQASNTENCCQRHRKSRRKNQGNPPKTPTNAENDELRNQVESSPHEDHFNPRFSSTYQSLKDVTPPAMMCEHESEQESEHFYTPNCSHDLASKNQNTPRLVLQNTGDQTKCTPSSLITKHICDKISAKKRQLEQLVGSVGGTLVSSSEDTIGDVETKKSAALDRQHGGDDLYLPYCAPSCSKDPPVINSDVPDSYEYYRITGNIPSPRTQDNLGLSAIPNESGLRTNTLEDTPIDLEESHVSCDFENRKSLKMDEITNNANIVANAFAHLSLAQKGLQEKKNAFNTLTESYLSSASNPNETKPPNEGSPSTQKLLETVCKNSSKFMEQFDDSEWNDNAFKDRDFVRLLPFYENVHNQLEYISKKQREFGVNMLDDVMSSFYHIHYELGDPRLKNDLLIEHVRMITRNTWESYFYKDDKKMPAIPDQPPPSYSERSPDVSQLYAPSPIQPRLPSPRPPNRRPSSHGQSRPTHQPPNTSNASTPINVNRRLRATSSQGVRDEPQPTNSPPQPTQLPSDAPPARQSN